ncbi:MAG: hypothetical protein LWX52_14105 [Deltaproteobacteria bacterium]|jgi:hypothetical protein|nr:hypothetical protein [Deltaproteobacteria bacterium]
MTTTKGGGLDYCTWKVHGTYIVKQFALSHIGIFIFTALPFHILFNQYVIMTSGIADNQLNMLQPPRLSRLFGH